jgi:hypothetical protein
MTHAHSISKPEHIALHFAKILVACKFGEAHQLLSSSLQSEISVDELGEFYHSMVSYFPQPLDQVEVLGSKDNWPTQDIQDLCRAAYVSIMSSAGYGEAVTVVVSSERKREVISHIEWGRP